MHNEANGTPSWNPRPATLRLVQHARDAIDEAEANGYRLTLRSCYYVLVAQNLIPNTVQSYKKLSRILSEARWHGELDFDALDDLQRRVEYWQDWDSPAQFVKAAAPSYRSDWWKDSDTYVEVWAEKNAVAGLLEPVCRDYGVRFLAVRGFISLTTVYEAARRMMKAEGLKGQHPTLIYFGDFDPSGVDIERDLEDRLNRLAVVPDVVRVALDREQVEEHELPPQPTKRADSRSATWDHEGSWELDALPGTVMRGLLTEALDDLAPFDLEDRKADDEVQKERIRKLADELDDE